MLHLFDRASMAQALTLDLDPHLNALLKAHIDHLTTDKHDLTDWTELLVVQPGDSEADIVRHIGFSPLLEPIDGHRFPDPAFQPSWDWLARNDCGWTMICTFGSTFAYVLFIQDAQGMPSDLINLCQHFAPDRSS